VDWGDGYLGLEVWLKCVPGRWASSEVLRNTDSSSIEAAPLRAAWSQPHTGLS
jgi:hypothetical protein